MSGVVVGVVLDLREAVADGLLDDILDDLTSTLERGEEEEEMQSQRVTCTCHREALVDHELCCGNEDGRDLGCPLHGDGGGDD